MFNYGKASAKPFDVPRMESVHGWSKTHKSKPDYKSKSKSKSNFEYNYKSNYRGEPAWHTADGVRSQITLNLVKSIFIYKKWK